MDPAKHPSQEKSSKKKGIDANYTDRFEFLMKLIRIDRMLKNARIIPANKKQ